ncbi:MAG: hypothetical protein CK532_07755 [Flavobacteriales bacterium]|nr:MAG: hypothetical protein CK532_07755 [Flavobacteriales bacterium]
MVKTLHLRKIPQILKNPCYMGDVRQSIVDNLQSRFQNTGGINNAFILADSLSEGFIVHVIVGEKNIQQSDF